MLRYICISDLHSGAMTSLLKNLEIPPYTGLSPMTEAFSNAFAAFLSEAQKSGGDDAK